MSDELMSSILDSIRVLIAQGNWTEVKNRCEAMLSDDQGQMALDDQAVFHISLLEALLTGGELSAAEREVNSIMLMISGLTDKQNVADALFFIGEFNRCAGKFDLAADSYGEAYVFYKTAGNLRGAVRALNMLSGVQYCMGRYDASLESLKKCLTLSDVMGAILQKVSVLRNIGRVLAVRGSIAAALRKFEETRCLCDDIQNEVRCLVSNAKAHLMLLDTQQAEQLLIQAVSLCEHPDAAFLMRFVDEYLGLLEYYRGNYRKAREYYQKVLDMPEPTASAVAQTTRMLTDVYIAEKKWKLAASTAWKAEEAITKINERIELAALWRAYGQIYTHKNDYDTAREHFTKSIDLLKEIGARYELALSYFAAGQSESYDYAERKRHLEMARMLFVEMDVPKRVEQMDDALRTMPADPVPDIVQINGAPTIIANCPVMKQLIATADSVAESNLSILLTGETGTGKDLLAQYIHVRSGRSGQFVAVNAAAIPQDMVEAELFGYKRGASTGARACSAPICSIG